MKVIKKTVQKFRVLTTTIIILIYCSRITVINCDEESLLKSRSVLGTSLEVKDKNITPLESSENSVHQESPNPNLEPVNNLRENPIKKPAGNIPRKNITGLNSHNQILTSKDSDPKVNPGKNITSTSSTTKKPGILSNSKYESTNTGALLRGASVFLGLSIVVVAYIIFRCSRLSKNRTQMVRKYGILAHRQDVEMRPLPLNDEDEDDTTVFDASELAANHDKQRRTT